MAKGFVFEPPSDEEPKISHEEEEEDKQEERGEEEEAAVKKTSSRNSQSPWDFASYSESVAEEHARRRTTSVDFKISKALQQQRSDATSVTPADEDDNNSDSEEPDKEVSLCLSFTPHLHFFIKIIILILGISFNFNQEDYRSEEDEDGAINGSEKTESFFAPVEGASFHANSFIELNLSRPLLRACEALGYTKPTPIQVYIIFPSNYTLMLLFPFPAFLLGYYCFFF